MGCGYLCLPGYSPWYPWKLFLFVTVLIIEEVPEKYGSSGTDNLLSQLCSRRDHTGQRSCGLLWVEPGLSPSAHPDRLHVSQLSFACLHLLLSRVWEKDLWFKCLRPLLQIPRAPAESLRQVPRMLFDSQQHQGWLRWWEKPVLCWNQWDAFAECPTVLFVKHGTLGVLFGVDIFCWHVSLRSHLTFPPQWHCSP